jgi:hypothetical protein
MNGWLVPVILAFLRRVSANREPENTLARAGNVLHYLSYLRTRGI